MHQAESSNGDTYHDDDGKQSRHSQNHSASVLSGAVFVRFCGGEE
jgi:hypothetical protein